MTAIERAQQFFNPLTGEALTLASDTADLARLVDDLRELKRVHDEHIKIVSREIVSRMDRAASWTYQAQGVKVTAPSPVPVEEFDGAALREALLDLADRDALTYVAVDAAVQAVVSYKPIKKGINALRKLGGEVGEVVNAHMRTVERERRITVTRANA